MKKTTVVVHNHRISIDDPKRLARLVKDAAQAAGSTNSAAHRIGLSQSFLSRLENRKLKSITARNYQKLKELVGEPMLSDAVDPPETQHALREYRKWLQRERPQEEERKRLLQLWGYLSLSYPSYVNPLERALKQHEPVRRDVAIARVASPLLAAYSTGEIELGWEELENTWSARERPQLRRYLNAAVQAECVLLKRRPADRRARQVIERRQDEL